MRETKLIINVIEIMNKLRMFLAERVSSCILYSC